MCERPDFESLAEKAGKVWLKTDPGFDRERKRAIWNTRLDEARAPDAIVRAHSADDAAQAIRFAAQTGLKVSPRGGGHHYEASALREGGILLDLGGLQEIQIDESRGTARVGAGATSKDLAEKLTAKGYAFPVGHCADVSMSGYILNGGFGWNSGEWGPACGNVTAIEMVTAQGEVVLADELHHHNLFWAARGAGPGFFAAITAYHLRLHPLPVVCTWRATFPLASASRLADWLSLATDKAPPETEVGCFVLSHWKTREPAIVLRVSACDPSEDGARECVSSFSERPVPLETMGDPKTEILPFPDLFDLSPMPAEKRVAADHAWCGGKLGELLQAIVHLPPPHPHSTVDLVAYGSHSRIPMPSSAALSVGGATGVGIYGIWDEPRHDEVNRLWVSQVDEALSPFRQGRYVGEADLTAAPDRLAECFAPETSARLQALRKVYDPQGVFFTWALESSSPAGNLPPEWP